MKILMLSLLVVYIVLSAALFLARVLDVLGLMILIIIIVVLLLIVGLYELLIIIKLKKLTTFFEKKNSAEDFFNTAENLNKLPKQKKYQDLLNMLIINAMIFTGQFEEAFLRLDVYPKKQLRDKVALISYYFNFFFLYSLQGKENEITLKLEEFNDLTFSYDEEIKKDIEMYQLIASITADSPILISLPEVMKRLEENLMHYDIFLLYHFLRVKIAQNNRTEVDFTSLSIIKNDGQDFVFKTLINK